MIQSLENFFRISQEFLDKEIPGQLGSQKMNGLYIFFQKLYGLYIFFTHEKDEEGRKMEYLARRQARNEDARQYYMDKLRLFVQAYPPPLLGEV